MDCRNPAAFKVRRDLLRGKLKPLVLCKILQCVDEVCVDLGGLVLKEAVQARELLFTVERVNGEKLREEPGNRLKSPVNEKLVRCTHRCKVLLRPEHDDLVVVTLEQEKRFPVIKSLELLGTTNSASLVGTGPNFSFLDLYRPDFMVANVGRSWSVSMSSATARVSSR